MSRLGGNSSAGIVQLKAASVYAATRIVCQWRSGRTHGRGGAGGGFTMVPIVHFRKAAPSSPCPFISR
jgi:hypothetical protein